MNSYKLWLNSLIVAVVIMVSIGGATRLTHSGLSMVEWKPLSIMPPAGKNQWQKEFQNYQKSPEYQQLNRGMGLSDFKKIFWWEYIHRMFGRFLGLLILLPLIFIYKNMPSWLCKRMLGVGVLIGFQGFIGWWMVKSGLIHDPFVSPVRLSIHLLMAFFLMAVLFSTRLQLDHPGNSRHLKINNRLFIMFFLTTVWFGGMVAGMKAGLIHNTFPLMDGAFLPKESFDLSPLWMNFVQNPSLIQFIHRSLALLLFVYSFYIGIKKRDIGLFLVVMIQVGFGITTLLLAVPVWAGVIHQFWAMVVWLKVLDHSVKAKNRLGMQRQNHILGLQRQVA